MGIYSTLERYDDIKVVGMTEEDFRKKWKEKIGSLAEDRKGYLDFYEWSIAKREPDCLWFSLGCEDEDYYAKHYADRDLADFISTVIAEDSVCLLEFSGDDNSLWGYYITRGSVKDIEYVRMVDGKLIDDPEMLL